MRTFKLRRRTLALMILCGLSSAASATNGYFSHGYGIASKGMGGADVATAHHALAGATNPAGLLHAEDQVELGADWFVPTRGATRSGAAIPSLNGTVDSGRKNFIIPEFGYSHHVNDSLALGVAVYGNGGMNTTYDGGQFNCGGGAANMLCGQGKLGVDLTQLIIAPTAAFAVGEKNSFGVAPLIAIQQFEATGLQAFDNAPGFPPFTGAPGFVTNKGKELSHGFGLRLGWQTQLTEKFAFGASYATRIRMSKFSDYKGLFADGGDFDIPSNYSVGINYQATPDFQLALDYEHINYGEVKSISNPSRPVAPLGAVNGPGFGWSDIDVWKLGGSYQLNEQWTLRAGYNHGDNPVQAADVTFNIIAPGVVTKHATMGVSYKLDNGNELNFSYMHAFENTVNGGSLFNGLPGLAGLAGSEKISMRQNSFGVSYTWYLK
jgi:long-chain fatty acid transport protein